MLDFGKMKNDGEMLLISTDDWFYGKDGNLYKGAWGFCKIVEAKEIFGFKPTGNANWYMQVGTGNDAVVIAGCRIHYAQICHKKPPAKDVICVE